MDFPSLMPQNYTGFVPTNAAIATPEAAPAQPMDLLQGKKAGLLGRVSARLAAFANRLEAHHWQRSLRAREAYLAQAQNVADLENRMREVEQDEIAGGRFLP